jgi:hypothetical protein
MNREIKSAISGLGLVATIIGAVLVTTFWVSQKLVQSERKTECSGYEQARPVREKIRGWQPVNWRVTMYTMDGRPVKEWHVKQSIVSTESQANNAYEWYFSITGTNGAQRVVRIPGSTPLVIEEE